MHVALAQVARPLIRFPEKEYSTIFKVQGCAKYAILYHDVNEYQQENVFKL